MDFSRNLYEFVFNYAAEGVFQSTPQGKFTYVNKAMARIYGYDSPEEMTASIIDIARQIHAAPEGREKFQALLNEREIVEGFEAKNFRKDGSVIWTSTNARLVRDTGGKILYYFGFVQDITARKEAEQALGESELRYRTLVEQVPAAVYIDAPTNNLESGIYISPQILSISGYAPDEWTSTRAFWPSIIHPEDRERFTAENERTNENGEPFNMEYRIVHKSGHTVWVRDMATLTCDREGRPMYWHGLLIDVTEQKQVQAALRSSEERFRKVFETSPIPICITALDSSEFIDMNQAYLRITGFTREHLLGRSSIDLGLVSREARDTWIKEFVAHGYSLSGEKSHFKTVRGEELDVLEFYEAVELEGRKAIVSMFYDTTAQIQSAKALRESEEKYRALVENIPAIVYLDPADGSENTIYINSQIETTLGYTAEEWLADPKLWEKSIHADDLKRILAEDQRTDQNGDRFSVEYRMVTRDRREVWIQEESTLIRDGQGIPLFWQGFLLDITNRKEAQDALRQSEERFEKIFRASPLGICITTLEDGTYLDANDAYCALVEYPRENLLGKTSIALGVWETPEDRTNLKRVLSESSSLRERTGKIRTSEGKLRAVLSFYELVTINDKPCILAIHFDISRQQEAQEALRSVAASYRGLFDSVSDAVYILDREGRFIDVNRGAVDMYGYPAEFFLGKTPQPLSAPGRNDFEEVMKAIHIAFDGIPQKFEFWGLRQNGEIFPKEVRLTRGVYFGEEVVFALAQDITVKKDAEEALRRREAILEAIAYSSEQFLKSATWESCVPDILARLGQAGEASRVYIFKNKTGPLEELLADQIYEWCEPGISPQINNSALQNFRYVKSGFSLLVEKLGQGQVISSHVKDLPAEMRVELAAERIQSILLVRITVNNRWWGFIGYDECKRERVWSQPEIEALKAAAGILGAVIERFEVAEALIRSEERYRILVEQASDGIFIADTNGRFLDVNQSGCLMLGYTRDELLSLTLRDIANQDELKKKPLRYSSLKHGETVTTERRLVRKDGSLFPTEISTKRLTNDTVQGIIRDFTERRKALDAQERQLKELSVLQAIATAGANAHDEDELIEQATEIIGHTIYTDILGFLLVSESGDTFRPHPSIRGISISDWMREYALDEGVTGMVASTGEPVNLRDVHESGHYIEVNPISRSELCVPMKIGERIIGVINAESSEVGHFTSDDERLMLTIAGQIATAIGRLRTDRAERDQRVLAEALRDTAETLNSTLDFNNVLDRILENIERVVPSQTAMIMLLQGNIAHAIRHRGFGERGGEWINSLRINCDEVADFHHAIQTREPQLVTDTQAAPDWITLEQSKSIRSHLLAPILANQTVIGFIALDHNKPGFFTDRDKERLLAFSNQAATALENARLFQSEQQRRQEAETLREASAVVATTLNSNQAVSLILDQLARVLQYDSASVQLLRDGYLEIVGGRGWSTESSVLGMRFSVPGDNPNSTVVLERKPIIIDSTRNTQFTFTNSPHDHILSWMGVPLVARGEVIGMLSVDSKEENHFNEEYIRLVTAFANQAAIAIENARLYEQTEEQIRRLTSLRDIDTAIASSLDLRVTLSILLDQAMAQLQPDAMDILIYNPYLQSLETVATAGFRAPSVRRQSRIGDGLAGTITINRRMLQVPDLSARTEFANMQWLSDEKFTYYVGVPLVGKGQIKGVLEAFFRSEKSPSAEWLDFLQTIAGQAAIAIDNAQLYENLQRSNQELSLAYDTTLEGWGKALELRDKETEGHTRRVADLTINLARKMGIGELEITHIRRGVLLHDIGKMGVPDHILRKTGPLSDEEWQEMRQHPQYAYDLLHPIAFLRPSVDIPYCHHEKWDGSGYPRGLKGTGIPLSARVFAVVDVWDALLSDRPYRAAWTKEATIQYIQKEAGTRFDPRIVQVFLAMVNNQE